MKTGAAFILLALTSAALPTANAVILFVDLNNAPQEYGACMSGAGEENVQVVSPTTNGGKQVNAAWVERKIQECEANGQKIDSIVVSGHDGSGHFFGDGGELYHGQLREMLDAHPATKKTAISMGLIGCYPNSVHGAENFWLRPNENVKQTFGFPIQSPTKKATDTATLVEAYCKNRKEWAAASNKEDMCRIFPNIASLTKQTVSLCSREIVASKGYGKDMCYTYEELYAKCADFDPGAEDLAKFAGYFSADPCEPKYADPPLDKNSAYEGGASPLRDYYNKIHLWRHCTDKLKADRGYEMPFPPKVIRLIKYQTIKANLARLNARELADYDQRLKDLCLDQFALGDITQLNRAEMNARIDGAVRALDSSRPQTVGRTDDAPVDSADPNQSSSRAPASVGFLVPDADDAPAPAPRTAVPPTLAPPRPKPRVIPTVPATPLSAPSVAEPVRPAPRPIAAPAPSPAPVPRPAARPAPAPRPPALHEDEGEDDALAMQPVAPAPPVRAGSRPVAPAPNAAPVPGAASAGVGPRCAAGMPRPPARTCDSKRTSPAVVEKMAKMMKATFVDLNYYAKPHGEFRMCSHFHLVEDNAPANYKSQCIVDYATAGKL